MPRYTYRSAGIGINRNEIPMRKASSSERLWVGNEPPGPSLYYQQSPSQQTVQQQHQQEYLHHYVSESQLRLHMSQPNLVGFFNAGVTRMSPKAALMGYPGQLQLLHQQQQQTRLQTPRTSQLGAMVPATEMPLTDTPRQHLNFNTLTPVSTTVNNTASTPIAVNSVNTTVSTPTNNTTADQINEIAIERRHEDDTQYKKRYESSPRHQIPTAAAAVEPITATCATMPVCTATNAIATMAEMISVTQSSIATSTIVTSTVATATIIDDTETENRGCDELNDNKRKKPDTSGSPMDTVHKRRAMETDGTQTDANPVVSDTLNEVMQCIPNEMVSLKDMVGSMHKDMQIMQVDNKQRIDKLVCVESELSEVKNSVDMAHMIVDKTNER